MSNKEKCIAIIEKLPDYKLAHILSFLQGFALNDDIEDDLYCQNLYREYLADSDPDKHETVSLDEAMRECGIEATYTSKANAPDNISSGRFHPDT